MTHTPLSCRMAELNATDHELTAWLADNSNRESDRWDEVWEQRDAVRDEMEGLGEVG